jgi:hypothetical protein
MTLKRSSYTIMFAMEHASSPLETCQHWPGRHHWGPAFGPHNKVLSHVQCPARRVISPPSAGSTGFEGLILAHTSRLTGRRFFLAKSGTAQAGRDASTAGYGPTYSDIECKRYRRGRSPTTRDLVGGFDEAIDAAAGGLALWLVVSTGVIGSVEAGALRRKADREAVAVEIID